MAWWICHHTTSWSPPWLHHVFLDQISSKVAYEAGTEALSVADVQWWISWVLASHGIPMQSNPDIPSITSSNHLGIPLIINSLLIYVSMLAFRHHPNQFLPTHRPQLPLVFHVAQGACQTNRMEFSSLVNDFSIPDSSKYAICTLYLQRIKIGHCHIDGCIRWHDLNLVFYPKEQDLMHSIRDTTVGTNPIPSK
jgi:hypothetical protein